MTLNEILIALNRILGINKSNYGLVPSIARVTVDNFTVYSR